MELVSLVRAVAIGECMLELSVAVDGGWRLAHGGDTWNTAVQLARLGVGVDYLTALGADRFSRAMRESWTGEGLGTDLVLTDPERLPGLYAIDVDDAGERRFHYWRDASAARRLFELNGVGPALARAGEARLLYLSGVTLSLFDASGRARLAELAATVRRRGGRVAFDPNYRARGWPDPDAARKAIEEFAPHVCVALPTFDDEAELHGDDAPEATVDRWRGYGAEEVAVKLGPNGCLAAGMGTVVSVPGDPVRAVDTTGAGDAFNAGYLAARHKGVPIERAAGFANRMGAAAVGHRGAVMPRGAMPALDAGPAAE